MIKISDLTHKNIRFSFSFISLLILLGVTAVAAVAQAQEAAETPMTDTSVFDDLRAQREALINNVPPPTTTETQVPQEIITEVPTQELRTSLQIQSQTRITNLAANISNRLDAYVVRLDNIAARLESRILIVSADGVDTQVSLGHLTSAKVHLTDAKTKLSTIDAQVATVVGGTQAWAAWQNLKALYQAIKGDIQAAHEDMRLALSTLKTSLEAPAVTEPIEIDTISTEEVTPE